MLFLERTATLHPLQQKCNQNMATDESHLLALPPELLDHICSYVTAEWLPVVRLSCHTPNIAAFYHFATEYLRYLRCFDNFDCGVEFVNPHCVCEASTPLRQSEQPQNFGYQLRWTTGTGASLQPTQQVQAFFDHTHAHQSVLRRARWRCIFREVAHLFAGWSDFSNYVRAWACRMSRGESTTLAQNDGAGLSV